MNQEPNPIRNAFLSDAQYMSQDKKLRDDLMVQMQIAQYGKEQFTKQIILAGQSKGKKIIFVYGKTQPDDKFMPQFVGKLASLIHQSIDKGFIIVYCNTGLMTHSNLKTFLRQYQLLPVEYFSNLEKFYILHGNMFVKSWFWFQKVIQIWALKQKVVYVSKVKDFREFDFFQQEQFKLLPQECYDGTQNQLHFEAQLVEQKQEKQVFHTKLEEYELNAIGIPVNLDLVTSQLLNHKTILEEEGLFRVSCSNQQKKELEEYLRLQQYQMLNDFVDGPTLAAFIKRFYDVLDEPLFLFENYPKITQFKLEDYDFIVNIIDQLPKLNQTILKFTIALLHRIQLYKDKNKMTSYNLAAVLGVSLVRPRQYTVADIQNSKTIVAFVESIIVHKDKVKYFIIKIYPDLEVEQFLTYIIN